jgi:hypothetical protein
MKRIVSTRVAIERQARTERTVQEIVEVLKRHLASEWEATAIRYARAMMFNFNREMEQLEEKESADRLRNRLDSRLDPPMLGDLITIGGNYFQNGNTGLGEWSQLMIDDLGDWVKPHLRLVYDTLIECFVDAEAEERLDRESMNTSIKAWRPNISSGSHDLTVPYRGQQKMTRRLYEMILEGRLKELIDQDPERARIELTNSPEHNPDLYEIATIYGGPKDWPAQIMACGQMQMCLDLIDWTKEGETLYLPADELPTLDAITSQLPGEAPGHLASFHRNAAKQSTAQKPSLKSGCSGAKAEHLQGTEMAEHKQCLLGLLCLKGRVRRLRVLQ